MNTKKGEKLESQKTVTARINNELYSRMQAWLETNDMSANQLLNRAVDQYISQEQTLKAVPISKGNLDKAIDKVIDKHGSTLDKLK